MKKLFLLLFILFCIFSLTGCTTGTKEQLSDTSDSESADIDFDQITPMQYESYGSPRYGVFFEFENTSDQNIIIDSMQATFYTSDGTELETNEVNFAPAFLKPGDVGYGGGFRFDVDEKFPSEGVTAKIEANYSYDPDGRKIFICEDPVIIPLEDATTVGNLGIQVTIENTDDYRILSPIAMAGLFDDSGKLIGFGLDSYPTAIEPGDKEIEFIDDILVYPNMSLDLVTKIEPRARLNQLDLPLEE